MPQQTPDIRPQKVLDAREAIARGKYGAGSTELGIARRRMVRTVSRAKRIPPPRPEWDEMW